MERYEDSLFTVRFIGPELNSVGVGIYDLGLTLISLQRLVHKAYLSSNERLAKGAFPAREERLALALQIGERKKGSDAFGLLPIVNVDAALDVLKYCADAVFSGIVGYYASRSLQNIGSDDDKQAAFMSSIYKELRDIVDRVDERTLIHGVEIGAPFNKNNNPVVFDAERKNYLKSLGDQYVLGEYQALIGDIFKLYPNSRIVTIR